MTGERRFKLFSGDDYYPQGGAGDFRGSFPTVSAAMDSFDPKTGANYDKWAHVFDTESDTIVAEVYCKQWETCRISPKI